MVVKKPERRILQSLLLYVKVLSYIHGTSPDAMKMASPFQTNQTALLGKEHKIQLNPGL